MQYCNSFECVFQVKWTVEQTKDLPVRGIGNVLNFAPFYEAFLAVVRREKSTWSTRVQSSQQEWHQNFNNQHNRIPTPDEVQQHVRSLEEDAINVSLNVFHDAMSHVARNPDLVSGGQVGGNVHDWLANKGGRNISFEYAVDLVYHWLKHARPGQTIEEYVQEANEQLAQAVRSNIVNVNRDTVVVKNHLLTLVVSIRNGVAYLTTFYYRD